MRFDCNPVVSDHKLTSCITFSIYSSVCVGSVKEYFVEKTYMHSIPLQSAQDARLRERSKRTLMMMLLSFEFAILLCFVCGAIGF
jgi:hypothetical protein